MKRLLLFFWFFFVCGSASAARTDADRAEGLDWERLSETRIRREIERGNQGPRWLDDFAQARQVAEFRNTGLLVLFTRRDETFSHRMKSETLADPRVWMQLGRYTLLELNVDRHPERAFDYQLDAVPALLWLDPEGREQHRVVGFVGADDLLAFLERIRRPDAVVLPPRHAGLMERLQRDPHRRETMIEALEQLRGGPAAARFRLALRELRPPPAALWIELLSDPVLSVRLGALELLEELAGDTFGFDPWLPPGRQEEELESWRAWMAERKPEDLRRFAPLSRSRMLAAVRELDAADEAQAQRAVRTLERAGKGLLPHLETLLTEEPLRPGQRQRLEEVMLSLRISALGWPDGPGVAFRLRRGPLDVRMRVLRELALEGPEAVPILSAYLGDPEVLIRESALEGLLQAGGESALPTVLNRLREETSPDIALAAMRQLTDLSDPTATAWLRSQLESDVEERILGALEAMRGGKHDALAEVAIGLLADNRWRVRAYASVSLGAIRHRAALPALLKLTADPDPFTRSAVLDACLRMLSDGGKQTEVLQQWLVENPEDSELLARVACDRSVQMPQNLVQSIREMDKPAMLSLLQLFQDCGTVSLPLAMEMAESADADLRASALRILAANALRSGTIAQQRTAEALLVRALQEGDDSLRIVLLSEIRLPESSRTQTFVPFVPFVPDAEGAEAAANSGEIDDLLNAFVDEKPAAATPPPPPPPDALDLDNLLDAFDAPASAPAIAEGAVSLDARLQQLLRESENIEVRIAAALLRMPKGDEEALKVLQTNLPRVSADALPRVVNQSQKIPQGLELARAMRRDPRREVRQEGLEFLAEHAMNSDFLPLLDAADKGEETPGINELPLSSWEFRSGIRELRLAEARPWIQKWLTEDPGSSPAAAVRVGVAAALSMRHRDAAWLPLLQSQTEQAEDPDVRALVWLARAVNQREWPAEDLQRLRQDPSSRVRMVLPFLYLRYEDKNWLTFPALRSEWVLEESLLRSNWTLPLTPEREAVLRELQSDPMPEVRFLAGLALRSQRKSPDDFPAWVESFPPPREETWLSELAGAALRPSSRNVRLEPAVHAWLVRHHGAAMMQRYAVAAVGETVPVAGVEESMLPEDASGEDASIPPPVVLLFTQPGCGDCEVVEAFLESYLRQTPDLRIHRVEMGAAGAMDLYDALYRRAGRSLTGLGQTPMLAGSGDLAAGLDDLDFERVGSIIASSMDGSGAGWIPAPVQRDPEDDALETAESKEVEAATPSQEMAAREVPPPPGLPLRAVLLCLLPTLLLLGIPPPPRRQLGLLLALLGAGIGGLWPGAVDPVPLAVLLAVGIPLLLARGPRRPGTAVNLMRPIEAERPPSTIWPWIPLSVLLLLTGLALPPSVWLPGLRVLNPWMAVAALGLMLLAWVGRGKSRIARVGAALGCGVLLVFALL